MKITFLPENKVTEAAEGERLLSAATRAGVLIDAACAGAGKCGKCKVKLGAGTLSPLTDDETAALSQYEIESGYRLACCASAQTDAQIILPGLHGGSGRKKKITRLPEWFAPQKRIYSEYRKVPKATMQRQLNDVARIASEYGKAGLRLAPGLLQGLHGALDGMRGMVTCTFDGDTLLAIEAGDFSADCYGAAFDIGTTTVVGMLWDLASGALVDVEAKTNYQTAYGADVISRIQFSLEAPENLVVLQQSVLRCCNDILQELYDRNGIMPRHVYDVSAVGNTTMSHLFLGVTPRSMSRTPFAPVFCEAQSVQARALGLNVNPLASVYLLENIAGHVGSDIVGMMCAVGMDSLKGSHIAIDIGTNGEVVAIKGGRMLTCSTAAGPAFEGATIQRGMRAAPGAIERVCITKDGVDIGTIDGLPAIGICGSGLIDAVAELLKAGIVDSSGRMLSQAQAAEAGIPAPLASRIVLEGQHPAFVLCHDAENDILLTQGDVREVQLAKGAILAGIQTLMKQLDMQRDDIDSILLAGAFGNYIDKASALRIGLFPQVPEDKIIAVGNAAGAGASMALLSSKERAHCAEMARATEHVELSMNPDFQDHYITAMTFANE